MRSVKDLYRQIMKVCLVLAGVFAFLFLINLFYIVVNGAVEISSNSFAISDDFPFAKFNFWFIGSVILALLLVSRIMHDLVERKGKLVDAESYRKAMRAKRAAAESKTDFIKKSDEVDSIKDQTTKLAILKKKREEAKAVKDAEKAEKAQKREEQRKIKEAEKAEKARIKEEQRLEAEAQKAEQARIKEEERLVREAEKAEQARLKEEAKQAKEAEQAEQARIKEEERLAEEAKAAEQARIEEAKKLEEAEQAESVQEVEEITEEPEPEVTVEPVIKRVEEPIVARVEESPILEEEPEPVITEEPETTETIAPVYKTVTKQIVKKAIPVTRTKTDIIELINNTTDVSKNKANKFLKAFAEVVKETLVLRNDVELDELGTFTTIEMPAKDAVNPQTKQKIVVPAHHQVRFRISPMFKEFFDENFVEQKDEVIEVTEEVLVEQQVAAPVEEVEETPPVIEEQAPVITKEETVTEEVISPVESKSEEKPEKKTIVTKTKTDFIQMINDTTDVSKNKANKFLKAFAEAVKQALINREDVVLDEIGTFTTIEMPAKDAVNPQTKQKIVVPAHHQVRFRVSNELREMVDNGPEITDVEVEEQPQLEEKPEDEVVQEVPVIKEVPKKAPLVEKETPKKPPVLQKTKADLIEIIVAESGISKNKANKFLKEFAEVIKDALISREEVTLDDFGTFTTIEMPAKDAVNPQTKQKIVVPAHHQVRFRVSDSFKDKFND